MSPKRFLLVFAILLFCALIFPASSTNITFQKIGYVNDYDIQIRTGTGTLYGIYNTSSYDIQLLDNGSYIFMLQYPTTGSTQLDEPDAAATAFFEKMRENWKGLIILAIGVGVILLLAGNRRRRHG